MRFVSVKTVEQQDLQALHRIRQLLVAQRTAIINQVRGVLAERGIVVAKKPASFHKRCPRCWPARTQNSRRTVVTSSSKRWSTWTMLRSTSQAAIPRSRLSWPRTCKRISAIAGIGPVTATAMVAAVGDASEFDNERHLAAWLGLVPRQHSSGGKSRLGGISKRGNTYLRTLLIHGRRPAKSP